MVLYVLFILERRPKAFYSPQSRPDWWSPRRSPARGSPAQCQTAPSAQWSWCFSLSPSRSPGWFGPFASRRRLWSRWSLGTNGQLNWTTWCDRLVVSVSVCRWHGSRRGAASVYLYPWCTRWTLYRGCHRAEPPPGSTCNRPTPIWSTGTEKTINEKVKVNKSNIAGKPTSSITHYWVINL